MTITQAGPKCDVCGDFILWDKSINPFSVRGINRDLHSHDKCKCLVLAAKADWEKLPRGPLRAAFIKAEAKKCDD